MNPIPEGWNTREIGAKGVHWYASAPERVRYVGEAVAAVVAEDRCDRLGGLRRDRRRLRGAARGHRSRSRRMEPGAPLVEPDWGDNLIITRDCPAATPMPPSPPPSTCSTASSGRTGSPACPIEPRGVRRQLRPLQRPPHVLGLDPEPAPAAHLPGRDARMPESGDPGRSSRTSAAPSGSSSRRSRRSRWSPTPRAQAGPAGQVDRGAERELPGRRALARHALRLRGRLPAPTAASPACASRSSPTSAPPPPCSAGACRS